ncbi:universal stress protein PHOS34-like isoform X1 [Haliotis rufescens]|uniref:universal stress protein PHOS34-like isoform X1 n=1 Tax=Haliotis rufescens TaxID=6454 RepID=UPI00201F12F0|nr:universal stress protein PHOS34-like isoform X1 [Haliotis rufescens]
MAGGETKVLVAVDPSDLSERAFRWYLARFNQPLHKVKICHVPEYWGDDDRMMSPARRQELVDKTSASTKQMKLKYDAICKEFGIEHQFEELKGKEVWHEICVHAKKINAHIIVMGTRGMGTIKRTILGSVSDGVLHHCHIPTLIYKE